MCLKRNSSLQLRALGNMLRINSITESPGPQNKPCHGWLLALLETSSNLEMLEIAEESGQTLDRLLYRCPENNMCLMSIRGLGRLAALLTNAVAAIPRQRGALSLLDWFSQYLPGALASSGSIPMLQSLRSETHILLLEDSSRNGSCRVE